MSRETWTIIHSGLPARQMPDGLTDSWHPPKKGLAIPGRQLTLEERVALCAKRDPAAAGQLGERALAMAP